MVSAPSAAGSQGRRADLLGIHHGLDASVLQGPLADPVDPLAGREGRRPAREEVVGVRDLESARSRGRPRIRGW